nr:hypothetical protein Caab_146 [Calliteara abietis nucleopolyhedrovirus]
MSTLKNKTLIKTMERHAVRHPNKNDNSTGGNINIQRLEKNFQCKSSSSSSSSFSNEAAAASASVASASSLEASIISQERKGGMGGGKERNASVKIMSSHNLQKIIKAFVILKQSNRRLIECVNTLSVFYERKYAAKLLQLQTLLNKKKRKLRRLQRQQQQQQQQQQTVLNNKKSNYLIVLRQDKVFIFRVEPSVKKYLSPAQSLTNKTIENAQVEESCQQAPHLPRPLLLLPTMIAFKNGADSCFDISVCMVMAKNMYGDAVKMHKTDTLIFENNADADSFEINIKQLLIVQRQKTKNYNKTLIDINK